jgi:hypothetical protein
MRHAAVFPPTQRFKRRSRNVLTARRLPVADVRRGNSPCKMPWQANSNQAAPLGCRGNSRSTRCEWFLAEAFPNLEASDRVRRALVRARERLACRRGPHRSRQRTNLCSDTVMKAICLGVVRKRLSLHAVEHRPIGLALPLTVRFPLSLHHRRRRSQRRSCDGKANPRSASAHADPGFPSG